jgi:hypothetical protein
MRCFMAREVMVKKREAPPPQKKCNPLISRIVAGIY